FGRAWRRKAPVESLMPLRLARYGVPLAETAPSGLAVADIEHALPPPTAAEQNPAAVQADSLPLETQALNQEKQSERATPLARPVLQSQRVSGHQPHKHQAKPTTARFANLLRDEFGISTAAGDPLADDQVQQLLRAVDRYISPTEAHHAPDAAEPASTHESRDGFLHNASLTYAHQHGQYPDAAALAAYLPQRDGINGGDSQHLTGKHLPDFATARHEFTTGQTRNDDTDPRAGEQAPPASATAETDSHQTSAVETRSAEGEEGLQKSSAVTDEVTPPAQVNENKALTTVDRYYLAWLEHQNQHSTEPSDKQLSSSLADSGVMGRSGKPISPSTLRRYLLAFRIYTVWASHRAREESPSAIAVAQDCASRGITAQYNNPVTATDITNQTHDFERRWKTLTRHNTVT
ncbi:hypothetical protein ACFY3P_38900, partial [Streptomyces sp. NPDC001083]